MRERPASQAAPSSEVAVIEPQPESKHISRIDVARALKLRVQGNTLLEIADIFDVSESAVCQALRKFESFLKDLQPGTLTAYSEQRTSLLNAVEMEMLRSLLQPEAIEKATLNNRAYAFQQVHTARRLEEGKSTENVSVLGKLILGAEDGLGKPMKGKDT